MLASFLLSLLLAPGSQAGPPQQQSATPVNTCEDASAKLVIAQWYSAGTVTVSPGTLSETPGVTVKWTPDGIPGAKLCKVDFWMGLEGTEPPGNLNYAPGQFPGKVSLPTACVTSEWSTWFPGSIFPAMQSSNNYGLTCGMDVKYNWAFHAEAYTTEAGSNKETGWTNQRVGPGSWGTYNTATCPCYCKSWGLWDEVCDTNCLETATCQDTGKESVVMKKPCTKSCSITDPECPAGWDDWGPCYPETQGNCVQIQSCPSENKAHSAPCPCPPFSCVGTVIESGCFKHGKGCLKSFTCSADPTMVRYEGCSCQPTECSKHSECAWDEYCNSGTCTTCPADQMVHDCCALSGRCKDSSCVALGFDNSAQSEWTAKQATDAGILCPAIANCAGGQPGNPLLHCFSEVECLNGDVTCPHHGELCLQSGNSKNFKICKPPTECTENTWGPWSVCTGETRGRSRKCGDCLTQTGTCPSCSTFTESACGIVDGMCVKTKTCTDNGISYTEEEPCQFSECDGLCSSWGKASGCYPAPDGFCHAQQSCRGSLTRFTEPKCTCSAPNCKTNEDCGKWWLGCYNGQCSACRNYFTFQNFQEPCCKDTMMCRSSSCTTFGFPNSAKANNVYSKALALGFECPAVERCSHLTQQNPDLKLAHCYDVVKCTAGIGCPNEGDLCLQDGNSNNFKVCKQDWSMECEHWGSWDSCSWHAGASCPCHKTRTCLTPGKTFMTEESSDGCDCNPQCGVVTVGTSEVAAKQDDPITLSVGATGTASLDFTLSATDHSNAGIYSIRCTRTSGPSAGTPSMNCAGSASCDFSLSGLVPTFGSPYMYECVITDNVGNSNSAAPCEVWIVVVDDTPPQCGSTISPSSTTATTPYKVVLSSTETSRVVPLTITGTDNVGVASISCTSTPPNLLSPSASCSGSPCYLTTIGLQASTSVYAISCTVTDTSGNENDPCKVYIKVEDKPVCGVRTLDAGSMAIANDKFSFSWTVTGSDLAGLSASSHCLVNGVTSVSASSPCTATSCSFSVSGVSAANGHITVSCTLVDTDGNSAESTCPLDLSVGTGTAYATTADKSKKTDPNYASYTTIAWNGDYDPKDNVNQDPVSTCFLDAAVDSQRWGWVNAITTCPTTATPLYMWMGAAHCYLSSGTYVGDVTFKWSGNTLIVQVTPMDGAVFGVPHVYIGKSSIVYDATGRDVTSAPGQYEDASKTSSNFPTASFKYNAPTATQKYHEFLISGVASTATPTNPYYLIVHIGGGYYIRNNEALTEGTSTVTTPSSSNPTMVAVGIGAGVGVAVAAVVLLAGVGVLHYHKTRQATGFEVMFDMPPQASGDHKGNAVSTTAAASGFASDAVSPSGRVPMADASPMAASS